MPSKAEKLVVIYVRVSSNRQTDRSQKADLQRWVDALPDGINVKWFREKQSGKSMDRAEWQKVQALIESGSVSSLVVWRLDRLGRTASGLTKLFDTLQEAEVNLVSLKDGLDLATPSGRLMANVLASVAAYENEVRSERVRAGMAAAKADGKRIGGSQKGVRKTVTPTKEKAIRKLKADGESVAAIARAVGVSRPTVYSVLGA
ncbi:resolvase [Blastopirellula marina]|uniref:Resolvase n=1 Tax=Blastopirellula marina TaxID=124 RepID=A0A2S8F3P5_9BACT|nr:MULTISPECIES: recombinase family protein [Pirellulaceae]PQO26779.1 resolvase [Blastopirellula marina]RCS46262.1 recombinase family protein [Bremerella cremea]